MEEAAESESRGEQADKEEGGGGGGGGGALATARARVSAAARPRGSLGLPAWAVSAAARQNLNFLVLGGPTVRAPVLAPMPHAVLRGGFPTPRMPRCGLRWRGIECSVFKFKHRSMFFVFFAPRS